MVFVMSLQKLIQNIFSLFCNHFEYNGIRNKKQTVYRSRRRLGTWLLIAIHKHVNNLSVTLATDIAIECMTDNNNYWN